MPFQNVTSAKNRLVSLYQTGWPVLPFPPFMWAGTVNWSWLNW